MMMMISVLLFFTFFIVYGETAACKICVIDSICDDDYILFNISISRECPRPMEVSFSYVTELNSDKLYIHKTFNCHDCHVDVTIDPVRDAWDYTLTIESPKTTKPCSPYVAQCGGNTSQLVWIATVSLSGLFILLGGILCTIRCCRTRRQMKLREKLIQTAVINA